MTRYVTGRLAQMVIVLFIVSLLIFFGVRITPTDPIASIAKGKQMSAETIAALKAEYYLDRPLTEQYAIWMKGMILGDLGKSYQYRERVTVLLAGRIGTSVQLVFMSSILIFLLGIPLGIISASRKNTMTDQSLTIASLVLVSSPSFFTGMILMLLFTLVIPIFPTFGIGSGFVDNIRYLALPAISLAAVLLALTMRMTRSNMVEQLSSGYVQMATAKGLTRRQVVYKHALRNSSIPILTVSSLQIAGMLSGSVMVETVFALNGIGSLLASSVNKGDYPVTQSITLMMVVVFMTFNLIVDIMYGVIDPRIRLGGGRKHEA
ncbi:MAG: ABC transporter permease [Clostridiales bacterium]|nr:ABC transporter permease [Clostridiales bacterium]